MIPPRYSEIIENIVHVRKNSISVISGNSRESYFADVYNVFNEFRASRITECYFFTTCTTFSMISAHRGSTADHGMLHWKALRAKVRAYLAEQRTCRTRNSDSTRTHLPGRCTVSASTSIGNVVHVCTSNMFATRDAPTSLQTLHT